MFKLFFTNSRDQTIELFSTPFRLTRVEGIGDVEADVQSQKAPYQDGDTYVDTRLEPRYMTVELKIIGKNEEELAVNRRLFASVFNPKLGIGKLNYIRGNEIKEIFPLSESVPIFPDGSNNRGATFQKALIHLKAPNPYWQSPSTTEEPTFEPLFQFPFEGRFEMGIQRDQRIIFNDGDAPAPLQIEFYGPAVNPKIINNTTGEYIKINQTLHEGERMLIDTSDENKSVCFVDGNGIERNVFNWIDLGSTFFKLEIGENDIEYTADSDIQGAIVNISYSKLYTAV